MSAGKRALLRLGLLVIMICSSALFVACGVVDKVVGFFADDGTGHIFKIAIDSIPETFDPQLLNDENSAMIARNLYFGLMRYDSDDRLAVGIADDYSISSDGLTYTFSLKKGYNWCAAGDFEAPVIADDFVFAFRRLFDPKTESPHAEKYFCILNAEAANRGEISPEEIGVSAPDDFTVEFTLAYPNSEFLYLLAELPSMPCCELFFETAGGKYGLEAETTCSNGPFYVRFWQHDPYGKDNYVRLRRNSGYSEISYVSPAGINYLTEMDDAERESDFLDGTTEAFVYPAGSVPNTENGSILGYTAVSGLIFNEKVKAFSDPEIRQIFSLATDSASLCEPVSDILKPAFGLVPSEPAILSRGFASRLDPKAASPNPSMAEYRWSFALSDGEKSELIGMNITVPESFGYAYLLNDLVDSWYSVFGIHFGIEIVNDRDYADMLKSGDYDIILASVSSDSGSAFDFIEPFGFEARFGIRVPEALAAEQGRGGFKTSAEAGYACSEAENAIITEYHFIPLWYLPTVCAFDDDVEGLSFDPFTKTVYFENAKKF